MQRHHHRSSGRRRGGGLRRAAVRHGAPPPCRPKADGPRSRTRRSCWLARSSSPASGASMATSRAGSLAVRARQVAALIPSDAVAQFVYGFGVGGECASPLTCAGADVQTRSRPRRRWSRPRWLARTLSIVSTAAAVSPVRRTLPRRLLTRRRFPHAGLGPGREPRRPPSRPHDLQQRPEPAVLDLGGSGDVPVRA